MRLSPEATGDDQIKVHVICLEFRQQDNDLRLCDRGRPSQGTNVELLHT